MKSCLPNDIYLHELFIAYATLKSVKWVSYAEVSDLTPQVSAYVCYTLMTTTYFY